MKILFKPLKRFIRTTMEETRPKLIVFDLDYTLWPFWVDTHVTPPFRKNEKGKVVDATGSQIKVYPEVPEMLKKLHKEKYQLGIASRTSEIQGAKQLVRLFEWDKYFQFSEIYPGCKVEHFGNFNKKGGIEYRDMLFFDDEQRNITDLTKIGVVSILVKNGMNMKVLEEGLNEFAQKRKKV